MSVAKKYTVGQKLWWVPPHNRYHTENNGGYEVTVAKVAIKYVTVETGKRHPTEHVFVKETGRERGDYSASANGWLGRVWMSREAYAANVAMTDAWYALCKLASEKLQRYRSVPVDLTMGEIETITTILEPLA